YRCRDCHGRRMLCRECCLTSHRYNPFHRIEIWEGSSYKVGTLDAIGFVLNMGHATDEC
ncbi:hypothetical protein K435DRAFT_585037, partial [Dendrothele bispora CBS 962.96]